MHNPPTPLVLDGRSAKKPVRFAALHFSDHVLQGAGRGRECWRTGGDRGNRMGVCPQTYPTSSCQSKRPESYAQSTHRTVLGWKGKGGSEWKPEEHFLTSSHFTGMMPPSSLPKIMPSLAYLSPSNASNKMEFSREFKCLRNFASDRNVWGSFMHKGRCSSAMTGYIFGHRGILCAH